MRKKILFVMMLLTTISSLAKQLTSEQAAKLAQQFLKTKTTGMRRVGLQKKLTLVYTAENSKKENNFYGLGFALLELSVNEHSVFLAIHNGRSDLENGILTGVIDLYLQG